MSKAGVRKSEIIPKSVTFIPASVYDNKILMRDDPSYVGYLNSLSLVDRKRLLEGNWNIKDTSGNFFKRHWFEVVDEAPRTGKFVRYWDRAATQSKDEEEKRGPSYTVGLKMQEFGDNFFIHEPVRFRGTPGEVKQAIINTASQDGSHCTVGIEQDPGQAGKVEAQMYVPLLKGFHVVVNPVHESKGTRAKPLSAQAEHGFVKLVRGSWNKTFLDELENFDGTDKGHADQVDAASGAFHLLTKNQKKAGVW